MRRRLTLLLFGLAATLAVYLPAASQADAKTFYWISHGGPADPVWTYFLARRQAVGQGHRQHRQHLVPHRRRALAAGGRARGHRRQGRRHRHHAAPIRAAWSRWSRRPTPPASRSSTSTRPTRRPSFDAYVGGDLRRRRQALGAVPGRQGPGEAGRLRLDAGRGARRHLRRAGGGRHRRASSSRSASPGR